MPAARRATAGQAGTATAAPAPAPATARPAGTGTVGPTGMSEGDGILEYVSARMRSPVLVGRSEELAILDAALGRARAGGP